MQNILVIMENNSFLVRNIMEQLEELRYNVDSIEMDIHKISLKKDNYEAIFLYMESDTDVKAKEIIFIRDKAIEENIPVFYLGDDVENLQSIMPDYVLKCAFKRPIDVKTTAKIIDEYIKDYGKQIKKKVLVVDDSGAMLRNVKGWLGDKYNVILANSGTMAIKYLATDRPDLVLLDYEMPVIDGRQVLEMIRTETEFRDVPVIFLTSKNDRESILKVMELKPEGYLLKTMEPEKIVKEVDNFFMKQKINKIKNN
ncbi:MAG: response regulator [Lachnospiraceae bacterium]|nr:response regulator [Lachnospiraceae bacterium]